jgi:hypothetical protein
VDGEEERGNDSRSSQRDYVHYTTWTLTREDCNLANLVDSMTKILLRKLVVSQLFETFPGFD